MKTLTPDIVRELDGLKDSDYETWISESLAEMREAGDLLEGPAMYRNQGRCLVLKEVLDHIQDSGKYLERYRVQQQ